MTYQISNPRWISEHQIECIWHHETLGDIPFVADQLDVEDHGREIFEQVKAVAAPLVPIEPVVVYPPLTPRRLWLGALALGVKKADIIATVEQIPDQEKRDWLMIELTESTEFERAHPAMDEVRQMLGIPIDQFNTLWLWASNL